MAHCLTLNSNGRLNVIKTPAWVSLAFDPISTSLPHPDSQQFNAIWDTGATGSVISERVIASCGLKPIGVALVHTAGGVTRTEVYLINIRLPSNVGFSNVRVTKGQMGPDADVLIGMDIIGMGDLAITNFGGQTCFTFRVPSLAQIDFVKEDMAQGPKPPVKNTAPKVGRNDPCPCGSGKKFKKCCGK